VTDGGRRPTEVSSDGMRRAAARVPGPWGWVAVGAGVISLAVFVWVAYAVVTGGGIVGWDSSVTDWLVAARTPGWSRALWVFTLLGNSPLIAACIAGAVLLLLAWGKWSNALLVAAGTGLAQVVSTVVKASFGRTRPPVALALIEQPGSSSLPSGHAFMTMVAAVLALFLLFEWTADRRLRIPGESRRLPWRRVVRVGGVVMAAVLVAAIGVSRVYLGVHWASDVVAGWSLGVAWAVFALGTRRLCVRRAALRPHVGAGPLLERAPRVWLAMLVVLVVAVAAVVAAVTDPLC
jgi:undecaprenyl-diphosphatase